MKATKTTLFLGIIFTGLVTNLFAQHNGNWNIDIGIRGFKYSVDNQPLELNYNPVFSRWEGINQNPEIYVVSEYNRLEPLFFNFSFGTDLFIRYKKFLLIKIGYDYSNPFGIGGKGDITYTDKSTGEIIQETKEFSYTSHQVNYFIGPVLPVGENNAEVYLGFSPMSPTWVNYKEKYAKSINGTIVQKYNKRFKGFFGNCRALIGMQVPVSDKIKLGSEMVFSFFNGLELESGKIKDNGFKYPLMKWDFTLRYTIM
jgi:hypothetical protein